MESTVKISAAELGKLRRGIKKILPKNRYLLSAMSPRCRVAVLLPAYNEDAATLVRPLLSLARQNIGDMEKFEAVVVVNNSRREAETTSPVFLQNQRILEFLRFLRDGGQQPAGMGSHLLPAAREIQASGLKIHFVDNSSLDSADEENHVGHARNRGFLEITARFLANGQSERGIAAMTDCDCRLSPEYISAILSAFERHPFLDGLSGAIEHEIDESLPNHRLVKKAFDAHVGFSGRFSPG